MVFDIAADPDIFVGCIGPGIAGCIAAGIFVDFFEHNKVDCSQQDNFR